MKIVHLCLGCFFPDNYSYQENMLPKFHKELGHDVEVIASLETFDKNGKVSFIEKGSVYRNEYDIQVTRLDYKKPEKVYHKLKRYIGTYVALEKAAPDILFIHGCQFMDIDIVVKYIKSYLSVKVYVDNHADFINSGTNWLSKNILHKGLWRRCAQMIEPYTLKFYGVLPSRVDFLKDIYKIHEKKVELLVMGANDDLVKEAINTTNSAFLRKKYLYKENDFVIVTGGKIDKKKNIDLLVRAVSSINNPNIKLLVFGLCSEDIKVQFLKMVKHPCIQYIGWMNGTDIYGLFGFADLAVFPGLHSVLWEQAAGTGIPCVFHDLEGVHHVDVGGNCLFIKDVTVESLATLIEHIWNDKGCYKKLKGVAQKHAIPYFSYEQIANRSIQC